MATRVYELSKELGISNKDLLKILREQGFELASHIAIVPSEALDKVKRLLSQSKTQPQQDKPTSPEKVPSLMSQKPPEEPKITQQPKQPEQTSSTPKVSSAQPVVQQIDTLVLAPMTVGDLALKVHKPVTDIILSLLKQGVVANKNKLLSEKIVSQLAETYGIKVVEKPKKVQEKEIKHLLAEGVGEERLPVVVVIGHVDHGKTTLLDFIRKSRVAAKEKGGITQHLGAYEVNTAHGGIVFLDTPGHEAFSLMRARGIKVADIAILIVAADDGVMPQTVDAIKLAQVTELPIIVAINKVDKATTVQIETVKRQLAQYGLVPEDWGGPTVSMPISAKLGTGVNELLEVIVLQAQLMDLKANLSIPAQGFVLESKIEKGRGPVATVICQHGKLKVGNYFISGLTQGKVSSLVDTHGKRVMEVYPSTPVQVAGFDELPNAGDAFEVVPTSKKRASIPQESSIALKQTFGEDTIRLIIKADNASSREALITAIMKLSSKATKKFTLVHTGIGDISESDIFLATDTQALVYGFHVKTQPNALTVIQKEQVTVHHFDIIYKLLEELESLAEAGKPIKMITKKIGEASVIKVFDIKGLGIIAGAHVKSGRFTKDGKVIIWRGKHKVGEGAIKGLQRDRKSVKEVHSGFEFAFMVDGFDAWEIDDRVECYQEVPA